MTRKVEYDFLNWTSFPSSIKLFTDETGKRVARGVGSLAVLPGSKLTVKFNAKQENVVHVYSFLWILGKELLTGPGGKGTFDWRTNEYEITVPDGVTSAYIRLWGGGGTPELPAITWFDDLKIFQDGVLIYTNDFSKWDPVIGAGVGAGILGVVVPALVRVPEPGVAYEYQKPVLEKEPLLAAGLAGLGILVGGGIGLLTGMGIIPVPQIPSLGAAPEGPGAPARLGKYLITG